MRLLLRSNVLPWELVPNGKVATVFVVGAAKGFFTIWKEVAHKTITTKQVADLIAKGKTSILKGFKSKAGKDFEAYLVLKNYKVDFEFKNNKKK